VCVISLLLMCVCACMCACAHLNLEPETWLIRHNTASVATVISINKCLY